MANQLEVSIGEFSRGSRKRQNNAFSKRQQKKEKFYKAPIGHKTFRVVVTHILSVTKSGQILPCIFDQSCTKSKTKLHKIT